MPVCGVCGKAFEERGYQVQIWPVRGSFDRVECAEKAYRAFLSEQYLISTYGAVQAELLRRASERARSQPVTLDRERVAG